MLASLECVDLENSAITYISDFYITPILPIAQGFDFSVENVKHNYNIYQCVGATQIILESHQSKIHKLTIEAARCTCSVNFPSGLHYCVLFLSVNQERKQ